MTDRELLLKILEETRWAAEDIENETEDYPHDGGWSFLEQIAGIYEDIKNHIGENN